MAEVEFTIGHKSYTLSCQAGEERLLKRAAALLDTEAQAIIGQAGRMPEPRLLLLAGLMLADRTSSFEDRAIAAERELARLRNNPQRVEVPIVPPSLMEGMAELAARAEALAQKAEDQLEQ
ncbi:MAG TPA: cell division protein ZapA [Paracoccus sp. (in: a-proteobacteria)]|uniref:cell division protein ZapA n=1 Tax=Paracoccus sp. TaxID=267 RepID=UPI002C720028|nr:cell division protein ZapA [Paracoccus sp. (in: a-proteobacteria)]HWL57476.1 cell division protein ZapA [Paracoccus sp. (in: a-proteobacteria)]